MSQAEDVQMPTWGDQGLRKGCGTKHQRRQMRHMMRLQARIRQMESAPRRQCFVEGAA